MAAGVLVKVRVIYRLPLMKSIKKFSTVLLALLLLMSLCACGQAEGSGGAESIPESVQQEVTVLQDADKPPEVSEDPGETETSEAPPMDEDGSYTTKEDVALYIHLYGHLPRNFITKNEAEKLGWPGGSLEPYAPGMCIGGSRFGNYEGLLPEAEGRTYTECDIDTLGAEKRGAKRIVFSNDGLIYYTEDHYETFELLYGEETP